MTPDGLFGWVNEAGVVDSPETGAFLDTLNLPVRRGEFGYGKAVYELLRSGTALWVQPRLPSEGLG